MGKKDKPNPGSPGSAPALTHNPFGALKGAAVVPSPAPSSAPEKARKSEPESAKSAAKKSLGRLVLRRETKHRGGKAVVIVTGFAALRDFRADAVDELAKYLKQQLGCGGTVETADGAAEIILQGDRAAKVAELLRARGFRVDGVTS